MWARGKARGFLLGPCLTCKWAGPTDREAEPPDVWTRIIILMKIKLWPQHLYLLILFIFRLYCFSTFSATPDVCMREKRGIHGWFCHLSNKNQDLHAQTKKFPNKEQEKENNYGSLRSSSSLITEEVHCFCLKLRDGSVCISCNCLHTFLLVGVILLPAKYVSS